MKPIEETSTFEVWAWEINLPQVEHFPQGSAIQPNPEDPNRFDLVVWARWAPSTGDAWKEVHSFRVLPKDQIILRESQTAGSWDVRDARHGWQSEFHDGDAVKLSDEMKRRLRALGREIFEVDRFSGLRV